ncbi:MAG: FG-GAP repeat protein [Candidatus Thermoplasmatota archaeon]|nr:FG-GAP repeat protein [Candidatus Thermoplasmatota archaeon]
MTGSIFLAVGPGDGIDNGTDDNRSNVTRASFKDRIETGTIIKLAPGENNNNSYYYPVPKESTVLKANLTISNSPYITGGDQFTKNAFLNIAGGMKEYLHGIEDESYNGFWGLQNQTRTGEGEITGIDLNLQNPYNLKFVLPKNATITSATVNITGYQRDEEWLHHSKYSGISQDTIGSTVRDLENGFVAYSNPTITTETGSVSIMINDISSWGPSIGPETFSRYGDSISTAFLFGKDESMAIGAPRYNNYRGSVSIVEISSLMTKLHTIYGNSTSDRFGSEVEVADIDGDDNPDLIVGAPGANSGKGKILIFEQFLNTTGYEFRFNKAINGTSSMTSFGKKIAVGDMNGDGSFDIAVASDDDITIYKGGAGFDLIADATIDPITDTGISNIGAVEFIGDQQGSGYETLAVGSPSSTGGIVSIYYGSSTFDPSRDTSINSPSGTALFGTSMDVGYDLDANLRSEIAVGAPNTGAQPGWVGLYSISSSSTLVDSFSFGESGDEYGISVAFGPDMRGDGYGDLISGSPGYNSGLIFSRLIFSERFPLDQLSVNSPIIRIGGNDVWTYGEDHLAHDTTITSGDLSPYINDLIEAAHVRISSPYDAYVFVDIQLSMDSPSSIESSSILDIGGFKITYDLQKDLPDLAGIFDNYVKTHDDLDGYVHVPFNFGGKSPGGLRIDKLDIELDNAPEIYGVPDNLHINEGSNHPKLIDVMSVFEDDIDGDDELTYNIGKGDNAEFFNVNLTEGRYAGIDLTITDISRNWSGIIEIFLSATDKSGGMTSTDSIYVVVDPVNDAPVVKGEPDRTILQEAQWRFIVYAEDAEFDNINYSLMWEPENMTIDSIGTVVWTPNAWQIGENNWTLVLSDGMDQNMFNFSIFVINMNDAPLFLEPPVGDEVLLGDEYQITISAYELDPNDSIIYSIEKGPVNAIIRSNDGYLTWTPLIYEPDPQKFVVRARDLNDGWSEIVFYVNITFLDGPPAVISSPETNIDELIEWTYHINITDPDDDHYSVELYIAPIGMDYDQNITGNITWTPSNVQIGKFDISILIRSTRYEMFHNFTLNVMRSPRIWELKITGIESGKKVKGDFRIGGTVSVSPSSVENVYVKIGDEEWEGATINEDAWYYDIETTQFSDGTYTVSVKAYDGYENSTAKTIDLKIANDEGKVSILFYIIMIVLVLLVLAALGLVGFLTYKKILEKKEEIKKQEKMEEVKRSRDEMDDFFNIAKTVHDETGAFDHIEEPEIDEERLNIIDDIFSPTTGTEQVTQKAIMDDIPEDPLQKADIQNIVADQVSLESEATQPKPVPEEHSFVDPPDD